MKRWKYAQFTLLAVVVYDLIVSNACLSDHHTTLMRKILKEWIHHSNVYGIFANKVYSSVLLLVSCKLIRKLQLIFFLQSWWIILVKSFLFERISSSYYYIVFSFKHYFVRYSWKCWKMPLELCNKSPPTANLI